MTDNTELKRLADAAKNWGGEVGEDRWYTAECFKQPYFSVPDAEFIAACDPGNIRALIAENDALKGPHDWLAEDLIKELVDNAQAIQENADDGEEDQFVIVLLAAASRIRRQEVNLDQLRAEIAGLKTGYEAYELVNAELKAENDALRKSALEAREFILHEAEVRGLLDENNEVSFRHPRRQAAIASIDAAMGKGEQS